MLSVSPEDGTKKIVGVVTRQNLLAFVANGRRGIGEGSMSLFIREGDVGSEHVTENQKKISSACDGRVMESGTQFSDISA